MKGELLVLVISVACLASAIPVEEPQQPYSLEHSYPRYIKFPDGEGNLHDVDLEAEPDMEVINDLTRNDPDNLYLLFTRSNPDFGQILVFNDTDSITSSNFNINLPTVIIVHGWLSNLFSEPNPTVRAAFLDKSDVNVIITDWGRIAHYDYVTAVYGVPSVGRALGQFLNFFHSVTGAPYNTMHLVGFSLGAHVIGNAGREMGGRAARITGLDPAGVLWNNNPNRLGPNDGVYVEAIHTDGGYAQGGIGIGAPIANADFFPNGGIIQPGCFTNSCNHDRAWELFAASVTYNHLVGRECFNNWEITWNSCHGNHLHLGNDILDKWGSGMYRVDTTDRYPF